MLKLQLMNRVIQFVLAGGILALASGQQISRPEVPDNIKAPAGEEIVLQVHATGSQVYFCQGSADQKFSWTLEGPETELPGGPSQTTGTHSPRPTLNHPHLTHLACKLPP